MDFLRGIVSWFAGRNPMWSLIPLSVLAGAGSSWIIAHTADQHEIRKITRGIAARLYELRLFADEPALVLRAQWNLIKLSGAYVTRMLIPALILALLTLLVFPQLEGFYGHWPLEIGQPAIVTLENNDASIPILRAPPQIAIESPPVRAGREISWRIRPLRPIRGALEFVLPAGTVRKTVNAGAGPQYLSERRVSSWLDSLLNPAEPRLLTGPVSWIEIRYPRASLRAFGLDLPWEIWFIAFSMLSAFLLRNRLGARRRPHVHRLADRVT